MNIIKDQEPFASIPSKILLYIFCCASLISSCDWDLQ